MMKSQNLLAHGPTFREMFTPKILSVLRDGYDAPHLKADALSGLTVAIIALPLSMAIAMASGATPAQGLYTAIVGGFLVSLFGGSRFQIGGPAGAFIVLVSLTAGRHGMSGVILATFMSGFIMMAMGFLRLGTFIKFIPFPVTVGFSAGIGVIIFVSQIKDLLGLNVDHDSAVILDKVGALWMARGTATPSATLISLVTVLIIIAIRKWRPNWPGLLIAITATSIVATILGLPVETIGSKFGGIPSGLPSPKFPDFSMAKMIDVLPSALSFALLGAIESLLSAVVADGMTGRKHRSNCELVGQGLANIGSALFGGFCVTGTIARTATNVRSGAHGPVSGMLHAGYLLLFMIAAAPLAAYIPLASLAGVLVIVAWNMVERPAFAVLLRSGWGEIVVVATTLLLTVFRDLTEAIIVGFALGSLIFIQRMSEAIAVSEDIPLVGRDEADRGRTREVYQGDLGSGQDTAIYRITGALFFGATASISTIFDRIQPGMRKLIIDVSQVPFLDSTGANMIEGLAHKMHKRGVEIWITGAERHIRRTLLTHGLKRPLVHYADTIHEALAAESSG